ncbi:cyclic di-AMP binding protein CbpA [Enterococcus sp. LJL98]
MLLESIVTFKKDLTVVNESQTLAEALTILETSNNRCVPILDDVNQLFRGNIYKMHIYRHLANGGDMNLPVTYLLKNATKFIYDDSSYFNLFFSIRDLPYIAVLTHDKNFLGILPHDRLLEIWHERLGLNHYSDILTIETNGAQNDLAIITKIISKYTFIQNCLTLNSFPHEKKQEVLITLPPTLPSEVKEKIVQRLERKRYTITRIDSSVPRPSL